MKNLQALISELNRRDISLQVDGERLSLNAPKGAMTEALAEQIKAHKGELLAYLSRPQYAQIPRVPRNQDLPLSFSQQRLWFLNQLDLDSAVYNVPSAYHIRGALHLPALIASLRAIVDRHEVLRTVFVEKNGQPQQVIHSQPQWDVPLLDFRAACADAPELAAGLLPRRALIEKLLQRAAHQPFDLARGPLFRASLMVLADDACILLLNLHHIAADGWSMEVLFSDFLQLYGAAVRGHASPLAPLPIQYADFACWQRNHLSGAVLERQVAFWRDQLAELPPLLELPTDKPRPAYQTFNGELLPVSLPGDLLLRLNTFSRSHDATLFMTLLSAFNLLMARLSGFEDIAVGSPIGNREREELAGIMGFFSNTLVLRSRVRLAQNFRELLQANRSQLLAAYQHQDLPFEHLVDVLKPERHLSYSPLFQVMFTLRKAVLTSTSVGDWHVESLDFGAKTSKFDLTLNLHEQDDQLSGFLEYNLDLFEPETMQRWFNYYQALLEQVLARPDAPMGSLTLLPEAERHHVLVDCNNTARDYGQPRTVHHRFEVQALRSPDDLAVIFDPSVGAGAVTQLSFSQLNGAANRVAHRLRALGVGPEDNVGLCLPRSLEMVVAMLGILKAGATYVPLDPAYPGERLSYMLGDASIQLILTEPAQARVYAQHAVRPLLLDEATLAGFPSTNPDVPMDVDNLLYITYTSGSTGQPKGIALSHRALVNLIDWHLEALPAGSTLQFASMSFDASYHEIFAAWCAGQALLVVPEELRYDFAALPELLYKHRIAKVILPVVVLQQWAEFYPQGTPLLAHLRDIITTGEQLQITKPIIRLFQHLPEARLHNHYGPAETHVVTAYSFKRQPQGWSYHAPIGLPIANTTIYILDRNLEPVPKGVKGDLYIGGTNLARGYLGKPAKSAEKFVPHPFADASSPGLRLYKTGDLARTLRDGNIEFLGRSDHMIKLRGFRIEPGEVEVALTADPRVNRAVVVVKGSAAERRLVAYVILHEAIPATSETLRALLARSLPEFMIPSAFVVLETLPLTPSGKVDARLLPDPDYGNQSELPIVAPASESERRLVAIWAEILGLDPARVGTQHNFFSLGGHSLLATRVASRIRQDFAVDLPLRQLFTHPTVAGLALELDNLLWLRQGMNAAGPSSGDDFEEEL